MENPFDVLINSYIADNVGIAENFISIALATALRTNLAVLTEAAALKAASIGNNGATHANTAIRTDKIYWLDRLHENEHENAFLDVIDAFVAYLNRTCYTGIVSYEFHYALYNPGSFYKKHTDQFKSNDSRQYSVILYLNENWQDGDGGELCVYQEDTNQLISPRNGKMVFFKSSDLEHEVLTTNKLRLSITGWLKK